MKALEPRSPNAWLAGCVVTTVDVERASLPPDVASLVTVVYNALSFNVPFFLLLDFFLVTVVYNALSFHVSFLL